MLFPDIAIWTKPVEPVGFRQSQRQALRGSELRHDQRDLPGTKRGHRRRCRQKHDGAPLRRHQSLAVANNLSDGNQAPVEDSCTPGAMDRFGRRPAQLLKYRPFSIEAKDGQGATRANPSASAHWDIKLIAPAKGNQEFGRVAAWRLKEIKHSPTYAAYLWQNCVIVDGSYVKYPFVKYYRPATTVVGVKVLTT